MFTNNRNSTKRVAVVKPRNKSHCKQDMRKEAELTYWDGQRENEILFKRN